MTQPSSRDAAYFDRIYAADPDPWRFATSPYEREKYAATLAALSDRRYDRALEIGCSIGILTQRLAPLCASVLALDISEPPLVQARARCRDLPQVSFQQRAVPGFWPDGRFDLIVLSEVLYFLAPQDIAAVAKHAVASLSPGGRVLLVNWLGSADNPCGGAEAANLFIEAAGMAFDHPRRSETVEYRLDLMVAPP